MHAAWVDVRHQRRPGLAAVRHRSRRATMRFDTSSQVVQDPRSWERAFWQRPALSPCRPAGHRKEVEATMPGPDTQVRTSGATDARGRGTGLRRSPGAEGAPARARPAGRGQPTFPGTRSGRAGRDRGQATDRGRGTAGVLDRVRHRLRGPGGGAAPRGEHPQGRQPAPHLRPRRHRSDGGAPLAGPDRPRRPRGPRGGPDILCRRSPSMLRQGQVRFGATPRARSGVVRALARLPGPVRRTAIRVAGTRPRLAATFGPAVGVTSIGMFTSGWGWAIPLAPLTLIVTVGAGRGPTRRPRRPGRGQAVAAAHPELRPRRHRRGACRPLHRDTPVPGRERRGVRRHDPTVRQIAVRVDCSQSWRIVAETW